MGINDITGDTISTPSPTQAYRDNYDLIFTRPKRDLENTNDEGESGNSRESGNGVIEETNSSS